MMNNDSFKKVSDSSSEIDADPFYKSEKKPEDMGNIVNHLSVSLQGLH